jgi:NAD+ diphosphatase
MERGSLTRFYEPESAERDASAHWFLMAGSSIVVVELDGAYRLPSVRELGPLLPKIEKSFYLGRIDDRPCFAAEISEDPDLPPSLSLVGLRQIMGISEGGFPIEAISYASEIIHWEKTHRFCSCCGNRMEDGKGEYVKVCIACGLHSYPRISPAVIVGVRRERELLLVQAHRHRAGIYSNVAGFVEAGESLEQTVAREVEEEAGIRVKNIKYFGSQAWPFPSTLMIGFTAEYESGEIRKEEAEIRDAGWFPAEALPSVPDRYTIARQIIDYLRESILGKRESGEG